MTATAPLCVRVANPLDAGEIAGVHVRAWQAGYRGLLPDGLLDELSAEQRERQWLERLGNASPEWVTTLVAVERGSAVGFCSVAAPSRDPDADARTAELATLYVDPGHWGGGIGDALMHAALELLAGGGARWDVLTLWMLEGNARAQSFYARFGFAPDGSRRDDVLAGATGQPAAAPHVRLRSLLR